MKRGVILTYFADYDELRNGVDAMHKVCTFILFDFLLGGKNMADSMAVALGPARGTS